MTQVMTYLHHQEVTEDEWWEHYCPVEEDIMGFQKGFRCDWCEISEEEYKKKNERKIN